MQAFFGKGFVVLLGLGLFVAFLISTGKMTEVTAAFQEVAGIAATNDPSAVDAATKSIKLPDGNVNVPATASLTALKLLNVEHGRVNGFSAALFGPKWLDVDRNGCSTFQDALAHNMTSVAKAGDCTVTSGQLLDKYTGKSLRYARSAGGVSVDRFVSLPDAWQGGAKNWDTARRAEFANDQLNLIAVSSASEKSHAGSNAAAWLPANAAFRCDYLSRQIAVKSKYKLSVSKTEAAQAARALDACAARK
jgi:hypothetical protein